MGVSTTLSTYVIALRNSCCLYAIWFISCFILIALCTANYPFHLEWMEGHVLDTVQRVLDGKAIYVAPSLNFVPYLYTPFYYYVVAFSSLFLGLDFLAARLVSILSILGAVVILYRWVVYEGGERWHGLCAVGLFFATYPLSGRWFDLARIDSLFLFLSMAGLYVFYTKRGWAAQLGAAILLAAAFFTKQTALIIALPLFVIMLKNAPRHSLIIGFMFACLVISGMVILHLATDGWSTFYTYSLPSLHHFDKRYITRFWTGLMFEKQWVVAAFTLIGFLLAWRQSREKSLCTIAVCLGLIMASYLMRINAWSYINVFIPLHYAYALGAGLSLRYLMQFSARIQLIVLALLAVHFYSLTYMPLRYIPDAESRKQGEAFIEKLAAIDGDIFIPDLQFVERRAGKTSYAYGMAAFDLQNTDLKNHADIQATLKSEMSNALETHRFPAIVLGKVIHINPEAYGYYYAGDLHYPTEFLTGIVKPVSMRLYLLKSP